MKKFMFLCIGLIICILLLCGYKVAEEMRAENKKIEREITSDTEQTEILNHILAYSSIIAIVIAGSSLVITKKKGLCETSYLRLDI